MLDFSLATQKNKMIEALTSILKIESVKSEPQNLMPYGKGNFDVLMKVLGIAGNEMDFDIVNLFSHLGYVDYGEGDEMLAILTHLDVVPAGEGWTVPPFDGTVKDGRIYGRGAIEQQRAGHSGAFCR
jgi:succinyl-diaminopimelate desuccinylase